MTKSELIEKEITQLLKSFTKEDEEFPLALSRTVENCFHLPDAKNSQEQAILILENLYAPLDFRQFLSKYVAEPAPFLSALIYGIYFGDYRPHAKQDFYFLIQILAENSSQAHLKKVWTQLSLDEQTRLLTRTFSNYREGSFLIQQIVDNPLLQQLNIGLQREFYSIHKLKALLYAYKTIEEINLKEILDQLETNALEDSQKVYQLLNETVKAIIDSSMNLYETLKQVKIPGLPPLLDPDEKDSALMRKKKLEELFKPYLIPDFTPAQTVRFARVFGLRGNFSFLELECELDAEASLVEKLTWIRDLFQSSFRLINKERKLLNFYIFFVEAVLQQMHAMQYQPQLYLEALKQTVFAMPTKGKLLSRQGSLITVLEGLSSLTNQLQNVSFVVFDQSDEPLFLKNSAFINSMNEKYHIKIAHLSKKQLFEMADQLGIKELVDTSENGHLGYAGVRNAIFLLAPMVNHPLTKEVFRQRVLGLQASPIFMFDDDNVFPTSNLYCHLMFVHRSKRFSALQAYNTGRYSKLIHMQTFDDFIKDPTTSCMHSRWIEVPYNATMSEYLSKPKLSINVPMGAEEGHLNLLFEYYPLLKASIHIPGTRFPEHVIPTRPFVGFEQRLKGYIAYAVGIDLIQFLIDPLNRRGDCALPWNDEEISNSFKTLEDVLKYIALDSTRTEMQNRFWKNLAMLYRESEDHLLRENLRGLINENIDGVFVATLKTDLLPEELNSLKAIAGIYKDYQKDANILWEYGQRILETKDIGGSKNEFEKRYHLKFEDLPLTHSFYLLCKRIGSGDFNRTITHLLDL